MNYINPIYIGYTIQRVNLSLVNLLEKNSKQQTTHFSKTTLHQPPIQNPFHIPYSIQQF